MCCLQGSEDYSLLACRLYLAGQTNGVADLLSQTRDTQTGVAGHNEAYHITQVSTKCSTNQRRARWHTDTHTETEQTGLLLQMEKTFYCLRCKIKEAESSRLELVIIIVSLQCTAWL